ncbi:hypothetical protein COXBURSA331_0043 (plasmid) [Coxiella burnetii RSA 331]|nr:hypothetical protein COXBURSA331_0043 [Coxiella burnetii RSA 331]
MNFKWLPKQKSAFDEMVKVAAKEYVEPWSDCQRIGSK